MPTVDEVNNALSVCEINPDTRVIKVPAEYRTLGVESDEKATRIPFTCPKIVGDSIDLTKLNLYINYENANGEKNVYIIEDVKEDGDNVKFSWLLSRPVTKYKGKVNYILCAKKSDGTDIVNEWNTTVATGQVIEGLEATKEVEEQSADVIEQILAKIDNANLLVASIEDSANMYYPNKTDEEAFNTARNSISGTESIVGSMGFKLTESNFHYGCLGLFVFKPYIKRTTYIDVRTMTCERFGQSQDFTITGSYTNNEGSEAHLTVLTEEVPYLYSEDTYSFSKVIFKNAKGEIIETLEPSAGQPADLIQWYGCVTQWTKTPSTEISNHVELQGDYYMPKADNIGAFYYVDIPSDVITQNLVNEPTCIKIDANYDSGTRQSYIDWGDNGTLTTAIADQCLKANYTVGDNFLTLTLKKNKIVGQGLEQKPVFGTYSCIRFSDHPEIGNVVVGEGQNTVVGGKNKSLFDYGFSSGKKNTSLGRYSVTQGSRNTAVYAGVALGNHNIVLGQSGFAAGATNLIQRGGSNGIALGSENVVSGKNNIAGGRANNVSNLYSVAFGCGNKVKGASSSALGYTNTLNDDSEFAAGTGNNLSGENAVAIGRANQSYGKSNTCIGYGNIVNKCICGTAIGNVNHVYANYSFAAGNNNTVNADTSGAIGLNLNVKVSSESGVYNNVGHLLVGSNNTINGGRNIIMGGQSSIALLHDSIVIGNNLKETSKGFGKAIFGSYNAESGASIVLGAGSSNTTRKNAFEVYADGAVKTPNARAYRTDGTDDKRLTTKEYVDKNTVRRRDGSKFVYGSSVWGTQGAINFSSYSDNNSIMYRDANGQSEIDAPTKNLHIANKQYVDAAIANAMILTSPNGTKYKITVSNDGILSTTAVT